MFIVASWPVASHAAPVVAVATALGATATAIIGYLQSERVLRPVAVAALRGGVPENFHAPGVILRQVLTWVLSTGVPVLAIVLAVVASKFEILHRARRAADHADPVAGHRRAGASGWRARCWWRCRSPIRCASCAGRWARCSAVTTTRTCRSTTPASSACCRPASTTWCATWPSGSGCGTCSAATSARTSPAARCERGTELGGQERDVAVLFVDLVGSTQLAATSARRRGRQPAQRVLPRRRGHRRRATAASSTSSRATPRWPSSARPIEHPDASGAALAASRELHDELLAGARADSTFGIGVSAGRAIAGHIGAQARFEYTVIGDPVNEAARLTELAKLEEGHVLASAIAVSGALDAEALCWDVGEIVELRGRAGADPAGPAGEPG